MTTKGRVLIVEYNLHQKLRLASALDLRGFQTVTSDDHDGALTSLRNLEPVPDLVVVSRWLRGSQKGVELATLIKQERPQQKIILRGDCEVPDGVVDLVVSSTKSLDELIAAIYGVLGLPGTGAIEEFVEQS